MSRPALALVFAAALLAAAEVRGANTPGALDLPPSNVIPAPVDVAPTALPRAERPADPTGNPLWAIPLSTLTATRERPIFLPSRRAPAPAVAGTPVVVAPPPPPPAAEPEQPPLTLVGVIAGDNEGFAVFLDQATNNVVRLKTGQDHEGWVLRVVKGREVTLEKSKRTTTLALPVPTAVSFGEPASVPAVPPSLLPRPPAGTFPRPGGAMPPRPPNPAAAPPPPGPSPSSIGAPKVPIPGDPRPLEDQL
jgi:general secretion pathway protein N